MAVDEDTVRHIAKLARIRVLDENIPSLTVEISKILRWIRQLDEVDTSDVEPMTGVIGMELPTRKDEIQDDNKKDEIMANAPNVGGNFYTVPKVVE